VKSGDWGLRVEGGLTPGSQVTVTKKGGAQKVEMVGELEVTFDSGVSLYRIGISGASGRQSAPSDDDVPF